MMPTATNLNHERKQSMKSLLTTISLALALVSPAFGGIEWTFPNANTPSDGGATITLGSFGTGWHDGSTIPWELGNSGAPVTGFWDLGNAGSIALSVTQNGLNTLNVFQWIASGTYDGTLSWSVNRGGSEVGSGSVWSSVPITTSSGAPGAWWEYTANLGALLPADTVTITAGTHGAIIDRLTLVPEPATLIAGAVLLIPFALSTWPILRRRRSS